MSSEFHGDYGHVCRLGIMVPVDIHLRLSLAAQAEKTSISEMVRRLLEAALPGGTADSGEPEPVATPVAPQAKPDRDPILEATPYELFQRGYSGNQIAAIKRLPYAGVMAAIGRSVDWQAKRLERMSNG